MSERQSLKSNSVQNKAKPAGNPKKSKSKRAPAEPVVPNRARGIQQNRSSTFREYVSCGVFRTGVQYANVMEQLEKYISRAEDFKATLGELEATKLPVANKLVLNFIHKQWREISEHLSTDWQMEEFGYMFGTANVVFMLQCFHIIEKRAKILGIDLNDL